MPPRAGPGRGNALPARGAQRGAGRGGPAARGAAALRGAAQGRGPVATGPANTVVPAAHIRTIGVKRDGDVGYGRAGRVIPVQVNAFNATIPNSTIHHYDVGTAPIFVPVFYASHHGIVITPDNLPARVNHQIFKTLQFDVAPEVFTPQAVYDGRKNVFSSRKLYLGAEDMQEFDVSLPQDGVPGPNSSRPPKVYKARLTLVATINPEVLQRFVNGQQSHDEEATTAITACNVALRMSPSLRLTFNSRSFFSPALGRGELDLNCGIVLWMGLFQSYRPGPERALVNVDIATGMMYKSGPLMELCLDVCVDSLRLPPRANINRHPNMLSYEGGLKDEYRIPLARFVKGIQVIVEGGARRVIRGLSNRGAHKITFENNGTQMTIAQYFRQKRGRPLQYPEVICAEVGRNVLVPLEVCMVPPGQIARKQPPPHKMKDVIDYAKKRPDDRFTIIRQGVQHLEYEQSEYIRSFGIKVDTQPGPLRVEGRLLEPPKLTYAKGASVTVDQRKGAWNMAQKKVYAPCRIIKNWAIVNYEKGNMFNVDIAKRMTQDLISEAQNMGISFENKRPFIRNLNGSSAKMVVEQLSLLTRELYPTKEVRPDLLVVILPDGGDELYAAVKHFGDIAGGVTTQCIKSRNCSKTNPQFWANVLLKINVKLGGINWIPTSIPGASKLDDATNPTIIMGADAIHPAPGADGRPSFTALVSSVDKNCVRYVATNSVQEGRLEIIEDLKKMVIHCLRKWVDYRQHKEQQRLLKPRRLIFFRDGVSEGQFTQVLDHELRLIKEALVDLGMQECKVTFVVVGKRHHIRFNPVSDGDKDMSGNAFAGLVVDKGIGHPVEFDFYLQSQGGLLGTSRSSHYNVLYDDNKFTADALQTLAFSLCHIYARATRSVSIPAPVYYADIVCSRAKTHFDPTGDAFFSDSGTVSSQGAAAQLVLFKDNFKPLSAFAQNRMYFS